MLYFINFMNFRGFHIILNIFSNSLKMVKNTPGGPPREDPRDSRTPPRNGYPQEVKILGGGTPPPGEKLSKFPLFEMTYIFLLFVFFAKFADFMIFETYPFLDIYKNIKKGQKAPFLKKTAFFRLFLKNPFF